MILLTVLAAAAMTPSPEAEALGARLAGQGMLATLLPLIAAQETEQVIAEDVAMTDADKAKLRAIAKETASKGIAKSSRRTATPMPPGLAFRSSKHSSHSTTAPPPSVTARSCPR